MTTRTYLYDARPYSSFQVTVIRYIPHDAPSDGLTLILAHANGMHKETWGPLVSYLLNFSRNNAHGKRLKIRDIWSIECPNHGESAVINGADIDLRCRDHWDGWEYPRAIVGFLNSKPDGVNFYERDLVAIGHSHGGNSLILAHDLQPQLPFISFMLMDPTIGKESPAKDRMQRIMTNLMWNKIDTWPNRKVAMKYLASQPGSRNWHPEVLKLFVEKGIRDHPAKAYPEPWQFNGVTLACTKVYEHAITRANNHHARAVEVLHELYRQGPPVHLICSVADEFGGTKLKEFLMEPDPLSGRKCDSLQWIEKGGHMFVQSVPEAVAKAICDGLLMITGQIPSRYDTKPVLTEGEPQQQQSERRQPVQARL